MKIWGVINYLRQKNHFLICFEPLVIRLSTIVVLFGLLEDLFGDFELGDLETLFIESDLFLEVFTSVYFLVDTFFLGYWKLDVSRDGCYRESTSFYKRFRNSSRR